MKSVVKICSIIALSLLFMQCKKEVNQNSIRCEIKGLQKGDKVVLSLGTLTEIPERVDSVVYDGKGAFELKTTEANVLANVAIFPKSKDYKKQKLGDKYFFLEGNAELVLEGNAESIYYANVSGGLYELPELREIQKIQNKIWDIQKKALSLFDAANEEASDKKLVDSLRLEAKKIFEKINLLSSDSIKPIEKAFVKNNPNVAYSAELLHYDYDLKDGKDFRKYEDAFMQLSEQVRNTRIGKTVARYIAARKATDIGGIVPNFTIADINGKEVSLSDYKGRFVLLEFWGTWCGGCRYAVPFLKELRKKIAEDKMAMLSIACGESDEEAWREFVNKEGIDWVQALEKYKKIQQMYAVQAYPTFFLISPEGKVLEKGMSIEKMIEKIKKTVN